MKIKALILIGFVLSASPASACFHQGYTCFLRCSYFPWWETLLCEMGSVPALPHIMAPQIV